MHQQRRLLNFFRLLNNKEEDWIGKKKIKKPVYCRIWNGFRCDGDACSLGNIEVSKTHGFTAKNKEYDLLAEHFEKYLDTIGINKLFTSGVS